jgi:2-polyprenyl-3-methyl-5-hydroxy-6-metoxy-1,4-benzoquinol methylase
MDILKTTSLNYIYRNSGNLDIISLVNPSHKKILDVGCGAGDNSRILKKNNPYVFIDGITYSHIEAIEAERVLDKCWVFNIESDLPNTLLEKKYECIIFSHILEHLKEPDLVLSKFSQLLSPGGEIIIAVPNILSWRMRLQFLIGNFTYTQAGELDKTHLRFFTYFTADNYLLKTSPHLKIIHKYATGSFPLWILRRYFMPNFLAKYVDKVACKYLPNLFGSQILIKVSHR